MNFRRILFQQIGYLQVYKVWLDGEYPIEAFKKGHHIMSKIQKRVLVADDDRDLLELLELLLPYNGYEVRTCSNGEEVFTQIENFKPDLVILDIHLGNVDGRQICQAIKTSEDLGPIPVIMISADDECIYNTIVSFGANDVISKPFNYANLTDRIQRQIAQKFS